MFEVGDIVKIIGPKRNQEWRGLVAEVLQVDESFGPYLLPLENRPDGFGRSPFFWTKDKHIQLLKRS